MNNEIINAKQFGIEENKAQEIKSGLTITLEERELLKVSYVEVLKLEVTEENLPEFRELRLKIVKNRTQGLTKWKTLQKSFFLAGGNFVQAIYNKEVAINEEMESKLLEAEKHFENLEKERLKTLQSERVSLLSDFVEDACERDLSGMDADVWESYLQTKKDAYILIIEAELKAEKERIKAEQLEKERIEKQRIENEKLKKDAEKREKEIEKERIEAKKKEDNRIAQENKERLAREENQRIQDEKKEAIIKKEREEKNKIAKELKDKKDAEEKIKLEIENKKQAKKLESEKLAKAPIKNQLNLWVESFNIDLPNSELLNNETALNVNSKFEAFKLWAKKEVEKI